MKSRRGNSDVAWLSAVDTQQEQLCRFPSEGPGRRFDGRQRWANPLTWQDAIEASDREVIWDLYPQLECPVEETDRGEVVCAEDRRWAFLEVKDKVCGTLTTFIGEVPAHLN